MTQSFPIQELQKGWGSSAAIAASSFKEGYQMCKCLRETYGGPVVVQKKEEKNPKNIFERKKESKSSPSMNSVTASP